MIVQILVNGLPNEQPRGFYISLLSNGRTSCIRVNIQRHKQTKIFPKGSFLAMITNKCLAIPESFLPKKIEDNSVDCILGMGAFYYAKNVNKTLVNQTKKLKKNGRLIFSLRNRLFDIITLNNYSKTFLDEIYEVRKLKRGWKKKYNELTKSYTDRRKIKLSKNIDEAGVYNHVPHNPITVTDELAKVGLTVEGMYFYHYHAFPPVFETFDKLYYRKISWEIENPLDWRGFFLASTFIVDCKKT